MQPILTIYWPGMNTNIQNTWNTCQKCNEHSPSQSKEQMLPTPSPKYPFQMECADYFAVQGHSYLTYVDCYSGWISIFYFKPYQNIQPNFRMLITFWKLWDTRIIQLRWWPPIHITWISIIRQGLGSSSSYFISWLSTI